MPGNASTERFPPWSPAHFLSPPHLPLHWHTSFQVQAPPFHLLCKLLVVLEQEISGLLISRKDEGRVCRHQVGMSPWCHSTLPVGLGRAREGRSCWRGKLTNLKSPFSSLRKVLLINTDFYSLFSTCSYFPQVSTSSSIVSSIPCSAAHLSLGQPDLVFVLNSSW